MKNKIRVKEIVATIIVTGALVTMSMTPAQAQIDALPGEAPAESLTAEAASLTVGSLSPQVTETGFISLSVDGLGTLATTGTIQVEKPAGATVRGAYFAAATTGFSQQTLADGDIQIDSVGVNWDIGIASSIYSYNYWADVTSIVKSKIDGAPAGRVDFTITEVKPSWAVDGEILAVIFDDPSQTTSNTIVLLFGAQNIAGDTFNIGLAEPLDKTDPDLVLDMSLGISYGAQPGGQVSLVDINGTRMTSSAGGEDDGTHNNGALLTVGGLDDSNANPPPFAGASSPRTDDELYDLLPFVNTGDTSITVDTINPSNDDNIFFASLFLASTTAVVGEGIVLGPASAENEVGTSHTVTATVQDDDGNPVVGRDVTFTIVSGPHAGQTSITPTDSSGHATFTYTGTLEDLDVIEASFVDSHGDTIISNEVTKEWIIVNQPPVAVCQGAVVAVGEVPDIDGGSYDPDEGDTITLSQSPSGAFDEAGIYDVTLTVTDSYGATDSCTAMVVVYDPSGGFVTGGGWIYSPEGAYMPDPSLTGKANFGFVSKYKKGAEVPTGNTEFQFHAGDLNFHSSSYEWLVVTGSDYARFKGTGTINGYSGYRFMLWAGDAPDTFRIKIWTEDDGSETVEYDNGFDQAIGSGSIIIHTIGPTGKK